ncbi:WD40 repeat domain-containing protein [Limnospira indica]|uniref:WD40 repeat domain-containing protein n=1 Tax=Limnospira TaxID=2596745 RepID=UPI001D171BC2|nr:hypothetical protein [Limnospira indica]
MENQSATFSPDGSQIVTASQDGTARLWDTQGNLIAVFQGHQDWVYSASFSPDGKHILTASGAALSRSLTWQTHDRHRGDRHSRNLHRGN